MVTNNADATRTEWPCPISSDCTCECHDPEHSGSFREVCACRTQADQGTGWYISTRRERVIEDVDAIYYVWADSRADAIVRLDKSTTYRTERAIRSRSHRTVTPLSDWSTAEYDFNEGMGR